MVQRRDTTVKLVELRQRNCHHLSVENIAPEIMRDLFAALLRAKELGAQDTADSLQGQTAKERDLAKYARLKAASEAAAAALAEMEEYLSHL